MVIQKIIIVCRIIITIIESLKRSSSNSSLRRPSIKIFFSLYSYTASGCTFEKHTFSLILFYDDHVEEEEGDITIIMIIIMIMKVIIKLMIMTVMMMIIMIMMTTMKIIMIMMINMILMIIMIISIMMTMMIIMTIMTPSDVFWPLCKAALMIWQTLERGNNNMTLITDNLLLWPWSLLDIDP